MNKIEIAHEGIASNAQINGFQAMIFLPSNIPKGIKLNAANQTFMKEPYQQR